MRTLILLAGLLALAATASCRRHVVIRERDGDVVVIERGHIHSDHCGHWFHRGRWHHHAGHVHKHGCGHVHRDGLWIIVD
jgi:hypothetical protein